MKLFITLLFMMSSVFLFGQTEVYCMIVGTKVPFKKKVTVQVDFGQGINGWKPKESVLKDNKGKPIKFESMIDALNYMSGQGWRFVDAYAITAGNQNVYHWIMSKTVEGEE